MPRTITPKGVGRPDFSNVVSKTNIATAETTAGDIELLRWTYVVDIDPVSGILFTPTDPFGNTFPLPGKKIRIIEFELTTDADTLIDLRLLHSWDTGFPSNTYMFKLKRGYQQVIVNNDLYEIPYPSYLQFIVINHDDNPHNFFITLTMGQKPL